MILDCYFIGNDGEETKVKPKKARITHDTLAVIISHTDRWIYLFKGNKTTIRQKFAAARFAAAKRLELAYKVKHIEGDENLDESFLAILEFLGGTENHEIMAEVPILKLSDNLPPKLKIIIDKSKSSVPPEKSTCDYLLVVSDLYRILGETKEDLRKGKFKLEEISASSDGAFPVGLYVPRLVIVDDKIVGVELWKRY